MPIEGGNRFVPPKFDVPVKNGLPKVTSNPEVEELESIAVVDVVDPVEDGSPFESVR